MNEPKESKGPTESDISKESEGLEVAAENSAATRSEVKVDPDRQARDNAFSAHYKSDIGALINFLVWQGAKAWDAAECAQEAMIELHTHWETIANPHAWVRRTASRFWGKRMSRIREVPSDSVPERSALLRDDAELEAAMQHHDVLRSLEALPLRQRQVLAWRMDGYTAPEIAAELGISSDAVRSSLLKARRAVAKDLNHRDGSDDQR
jgi:RNA polymerase sigma-70 factor (ECF subfamily)